MGKQEKKHCLTPFLWASLTFNVVEFFFIYLFLKAWWTSLAAVRHQLLDTFLNQFINIDHIDPVTGIEIYLEARRPIIENAIKVRI